MLPILLLLGALPALAAASKSKDGCDAASPPISLGKRHNVTLSNSNRTYMYFLPEKYDQSKPNPLILSFHGASRTSDWQANLDLLTDPFFNKDHVVVYPQALQYGDTSDSIFWQGAPNATANDVAYVGEVLDELEKSLCIDTARVYATGKSQGGGMVGVLACDEEASQRIAAFAPVSGAFYTTGSTSSLISCGDPQTLAITCNPGRDSIPVLDFHGGNDTTISINGGLRNGGCLPAIREWVAAWAARNNLTASPATTKLNGTAEEYRYGKGKQEGLVTFIYDGDHVNHDWPATINNTDNTDHGSGPATFNASTLIMQYFAKYTLPDDDEKRGCDAETSTITTATDVSGTGVVTAPFTILTSTNVSTSSSPSTVVTSPSVSTSSSPNTVVTSTSATTTASGTTGSAVSSTPTSSASKIAASNPDGLRLAIGVSFYMFWKFLLA